MPEDAMTVDILTKKFESLCVEFFADANKETYDNYIGFEKLCDEFQRLHLPKASDVLNVAAGPGVISPWLQTHGYSNIDAQESDPTLAGKLLSSGLYRNCIGRPMNKLNASGLKEDIYDAVVTVGGFGPDKNTVMSEIMRITKPDGHILFTLREDHHRTVADCGLLDEELAALERSGKCQIMKGGERFTDPRSGLVGLIYVIKRVDSEDFHPNVPGKISSLVAEAVKEGDDGGSNKDQEDGGTVGGDEWAENRSEDDLVVVGHYTGHLKLCQAFFKLRLLRNVEILDVSSHLNRPGLVGMELSHNGYENVDGLDHSLNALNAVRDVNNSTSDDKGVYRNYILGRVAELGSIPVNDESYDVILMSGGFAPGKILPSAFAELLRVLRPGGYMLWTMKDGYGATDPDFALFDVKVQDLVLERKWELLVGPVFFENFENNNPGRFYMLRRCHREVFALGSPRHSPRSSPKMQRRRFSLKGQ